MTRKHFKALAAALKDAGATREACERVATVLGTTNPRFDFAKFMTACGY